MAKGIRWVCTRVAPPLYSDGAIRLERLEDTLDLDTSLIGPYGVSTDGLGTDGQGQLDVEVPAGATVTLEGKELEFYLRKIKAKKGNK